jgi:hypothetical protein
MKKLILPIPIALLTVKKIKNILLVVLLALVFESNAQSNYIIAGQHGTTYVDIVPDTILPYSVPSSGGGDPSYSLDINNDGIKDIKIDYAVIGAMLMAGTQIGVSALDSNTRFSWGGQNVTGTCGAPPILKGFYAGDTIQNTTTYISTGFLIYSETIYGSFPCSSYGHWGKTGDAYIGVKYQTNAGIAYGWVKVNLDSSRVMIKEYSLGSAVASIEQFINNNAQVSIYPNPANTVINVELGIKNVEIKIVDVLGNEVISTKEKNIDVSSLSEGVYFVQIKTNEGILTKKVIISK